MLTTPFDLTCALLDFCRELAPGAEPVHLQPRAFRGAQPDDSAANVDRYIRLAGGERQHGWLVWIWPKAFLLAEPWCVAHCNDGTLRDVTPHDEESDVLFLPDDAAPQTAAPVRKAISAEPEVTKYLAALDRNAPPDEIKRCENRLYHHTSSWIGSARYKREFAA